MCVRQCFRCHRLCGRGFRRAGCTSRHLSTCVHPPRSTWLHVPMQSQQMAGCFREPRHWHRDVLQLRWGTESCYPLSARWNYLCSDWSCRQLRANLPTAGKKSCVSLWKIIRRLQQEAGDAIRNVIESMINSRHSATSPRSSQGRSSRLGRYDGSCRSWHWDCSCSGGRTHPRSDRNESYRCDARVRRRTHDHAPYRCHQAKARQQW